MEFCFICGGSERRVRGVAGEKTWFTVFEAELVLFVVPVDGDVEPLGEHGHSGGTEPVRAGGFFVVERVEVPPGPQGADGLEDPVFAGGGVDVDGYATAVVLDSERFIRVEGDTDTVRVPLKRFVHTVFVDFTDAGTFHGGERVIIVPRFFAEGEVGAFPEVLFVVEFLDTVGGVFGVFTHHRMGPPGCAGLV